MSDRMRSAKRDHRRFFRNTSLLGILSIVGFGWLSMIGCRGTLPDVKPFHENPERFVRLAAYDGHDQREATSPFDHPFILPEREWTRVLDSLYVQPRKTFLTIGAHQVEPSLAFDDDEQRYLANHLADAFAKAGPGEKVVFYLSRTREPHVTEITSGGFFVEDGRLHLVIANYLQPVSMTFIQQKIRNEPLDAIGDVYYNFVPQHDQALPAKGWSLTKYLLNHLPELVIDYKASLSVPDKTKAVNGSGKSEGKLGHDAGASIEESLRNLKHLREQGLISEDEYQLRLKNLMDAL